MHVVLTIRCHYRTVASEFSATALEDTLLRGILEPGYPSNSSDQQLTCKLYVCCPRDMLALGPYSGQTMLYFNGRFM